VSTAEVIGELDANFAWDGERLYEDAELAGAAFDPAPLRGAATTVAADGAAVRALRDPLGLNKLFWAADGDALLFAARPWLLTERGLELDRIASVPRAQLVARSGSVEIDAIAREIRDLLDRYLAAIAVRHHGAPVYVCMSGGLDSSGIAVLVAEHFPSATAVSFDLDQRPGAESDDRRTAIRLAADLGLPLLEATVTGDELLEPLDTVLREGIDWRDFNVHAALVNAALAAAIAEAAERDRPRPLVFTGDLANEYLVDYHAETYGGVTYYALPRLEPGALRSLLVRGLDTCHREVGVFQMWGQRLIQPYAVVVDPYMRLPEDFLRLADRKERLCAAVFRGAIPEYVMTRPKARAQVGGENAEGGVLGACVDRGIDAAALRRRFAELHRVDDDRALDRFIRAGRYRSRAPGDGEDQ